MHCTVICKAYYILINVIYKSVHNSNKSLLPLCDKVSTGAEGPSSGVKTGGV
jgi:hypothetical protein